MRESVIDVLFYLFDDLLSATPPCETDLDEMANWLDEAGFAREDINRAMNWFDKLTDLANYQSCEEKSRAIRVFSAQEMCMIDRAGQEYLRRLARLRVLDMALIEKSIEQALALEEKVDGDTLRWVVAMVVLNVYGEGIDEAFLQALQNDWLEPVLTYPIH